jgi:quercetin dioxygenase-like cupin family protein
MPSQQITIANREAKMGARAVIRMPNQNQGKNQGKDQGKDQGKSVTLAGQPLAFLVTGEDTKHTSMFEWTVPAGFSTGRHVHRVQEESFYVLEGECEWLVGDELIRATPGTYLFLPPGVPHDIRNTSSAPAKVLMTVSPPGHEHYFEELAKAIAHGPPAPDVIAALRGRYDTDQLSALATG